MLQNLVMQCFVIGFFGKTTGMFTAALSDGKESVSVEKAPESTKAFTGCPLTLQLM